MRGSSETKSAQSDLTPLLDVVLQLITFFMMLIHFGTTGRLDQEGATAGGAGGAAGIGPDDRPPGRGDGRPGPIAGADEALDEAAASAWWAAQAKARRAGLETLGEPAAGDDLLPTVVILRADRSASYGAVRRTLAEAQDQGFAHFSLVVLRSRTP